MNRYPDRNALKARLPAAVVALTLGAGATACGSDHEPYPLPACAVEVIEVAGRTATLSLSAENMHGEFHSPESVDWLHGDGTHENDAWQGPEAEHEHVFPEEAGEYEVNAFIAYDIDPKGAKRLPIPLSRGSWYCEPAQVSIK